MSVSDTDRTPLSHQLPFWWLAEAAADSQSLVILSFDLKEFLLSYEAIGVIHGGVLLTEVFPCLGSEQRFGRADSPLHPRLR